jgi:hypothetical protein
MPEFHRHSSWTHIDRPSEILHTQCGVLNLTAVSRNLRLKYNTWRKWYHFPAILITDCTDIRHTFKYIMISHRIFYWMRVLATKKINWMTCIVLESHVTSKFSWQLSKFRTRNVCKIFKRAYQYEFSCNTILTPYIGRTPLSSRSNIFLISEPIWLKFLHIYSIKCTLQVPGIFFANSTFNKKLKKRPSVTLSDRCRVGLRTCGFLFFDGFHAYSGTEFKISNNTISGTWLICDWAKEGSGRCKG